MIGSEAAMISAEQALAAPAVAPAAAWRARTFELAEGLFQSIRMQLSVPRYKAISVSRGANLDLIDTPLNNAPWLRDRFTEIRRLSAEFERLAALDRVVNWTDPGPGGFYDDLGAPGGQSHVVPGLPYADDPAFLHTPHMASNFNRRSGTPAWRISSSTFMETRDDQPFEMLYQGLDRNAAYKIRVVYGNEALVADGQPMKLRLVANGKYEVHGWTAKRADLAPQEFAIPPEATAGGELRLTWSRPTGLGGSGRGVQVAEVWIMRQADAAVSK